MPYLAAAASIIEKTEYILSQLRKTAKIESAVLISVYSKPTSEVFACFSVPQLNFLLRFVSFLLVNVLKKEVVFAKDSPVIKITFAADSGASSEQQKRKRQPGGGRKRSITKIR